MTSIKNNQFYGPPPPITKLTVEQDLKMRLIEDRLNSGEVEFKDVITVFLALQRQNFVLANSVLNLVKQWPTHPPTDQTTINEDLSMFGILLENKN